MTGKQKPRLADDMLEARVSIKTEDGDVRGAIRLAASDDTLAPNDGITLAALKLKHPSRSSSNLNEASSLNSTAVLTTPIVVYEADIIGAIKSFPDGSTMGSTSCALNI